MPNASHASKKWENEYGVQDKNISEAATFISSVPISRYIETFIIFVCSNYLLDKFSES